MKRTLLLLLIPMAAIAADQWVPVGPQNTLAGSIVVNIGRVAVNENGNRVTTIRSTASGYQMDVLTEFDCGKHRTRALANSLTDKTGQLISTKSAESTWFNESDSQGISEVCKDYAPHGDQLLNPGASLAQNSVPDGAILVYSQTTMTTYVKVHKDGNLIPDSVWSGYKIYEVSPGACLKLERSGFHIEDERDGQRPVFVESTKTVDCPPFRPQH